MTVILSVLRLWVRWDRGPRYCNPPGASIPPFRPGCGAVGRERETLTVFGFKTLQIFFLLVLQMANRVFFRFCFRGSLRAVMWGILTGVCEWMGCGGWEVEWLNRPLPV